ncbi:MAG: PH domain-containing protein [Verrucomicrobiales bacterium]|nr:PH domain-containing protein [Verrucomicrobiales bacterium]
MPETLRQWLLRGLRLPPEPQPPAGAAGSLRQFRAARNYYRLRLLAWAFKQVSALLGILVAIAFLHGAFGFDGLGRFPHAETWVVVGTGFEVLGLILFFVQLPITLLTTRLDYELRWYLVTDRSLRVRFGIWTSEELTMTFANIQEITLHQGPLQRWLGIADLKVRSAGGGMKVAENGHARETHVAYFRGVENATEIRDLILQHLRSYRRDSGLGDPDSPAPAPGSPMAIPSVGSTENSKETLAAARELLIEARELRRVLGG